MQNTSVDADGFTQEERQAMIAQAVTYVRTQGIEPAPSVHKWHADYIQGLITRKQLASLMQERAALISTKTVALLERDNYRTKLLE